MNIAILQNQIQKQFGDKEEFSIEITGNEELVDGENTITILVKSADGETITTYTIKVTKPETVEPIVTTVVEPMNVEEKDSSKEIIKNAIVLFTALVAIAGIIFAIIEYKYSNKKENNEEIDVETENKEDITFASIGFENEDNGKQDILKDIKDDEESKDDVKIAENVKEEYEKMEDQEEKFEILHEEKTKRKGKHF